MGKSECRGTESHSWPFTFGQKLNQAARSPVVRFLLCTPGWRQPCNRFPQWTGCQVPLTPHLYRTLMLPRHFSCKLDDAKTYFSALMELMQWPWCSQIWRRTQPQRSPIFLCVPITALATTWSASAAYL